MNGLIVAPGIAYIKAPTKGEGIIRHTLKKKNLCFTRWENLNEMNESFVFYNLPKFNQDEINNLNRPITPNEIEAVIKSFPIKHKSPRAKWIQHIVPNLQRRVKTSPPQLIHKTNTGSETLI